MPIEIPTCDGAKISPPDPFGIGCVVAPRIFAVDRACTSGRVFPLRFGGETLASPLAVGEGIEPVEADRGLAVAEEEVIDIMLGVVLVLRLL